MDMQIYNSSKAIGLLWTHNFTKIKEDICFKTKFVFKHLINKKKKRTGINLTDILLYKSNTNFTRKFRNYININYEATV